MWLLFDLTTPRILHTAADPATLHFDDDDRPAHLAAVWSMRTESIDDPLFLGVRKHWPELKLRQLYTWLKLQPQLSNPGKMDEATLLNLRIQIRAAVAAGLRFEPSKLPPLEVYLGPVAAPPRAAPAPKLPTAQRGSVGPLIHRIATEMWEAAGSPRDVTVILALRQKIMKALFEEHKIKTSTSSNELGRWQKQLVAMQ